MTVKVVSERYLCFSWHCCCDICR